MAHGSGPRATRPHQTAKESERRRRSVLRYAQTVQAEFEAGRVPVAKVEDAQRWAANEEYLRSFR